MSRPHSPNNPQVEQQYTDWVYPDPITDIAEWKAKGGPKTIPQRKFGTFIKEEGHVIDLRRSWHQMKLEGIEREMYKAVDGTATVEDLIARHGKGSPDALEFFKRMNRLGHLTFSQRG